ncbi:TPL-binding domain in jasmonate signaling [Fragilaria crotonensis]|nr:TPL-binding domain in jasmonate signaling [Fragilaria crotonensis]
MRRLSHRKVHGQERAYSYYRTLDSLLNDVGSILDNCLLYNSADSDIVLQGFRVIADATKLIDQVVSRHQKEQAAREKADEERRRKIALQYNAAACIQSNPSIGHFAEGKLPKSRRSSHFADVQTMQGPYTVALNRSWIERIDRDRSWSLSADSTQTSVANSTAWVPQSGDAVLYSALAL